MPEPLLAANKFGSRSKHRTTAFAEAKLAKFLEEHCERVSNGNGEVSAKMTFGEALKIHQQNQADGVTIKPTTRHSPVVEKVKPLRSHGATWTLMLAKLWCSAIPKRPQRIGRCAECH